MKPWMDSSGGGGCTSASVRRHLPGSCCTFSLSTCNGGTETVFWEPNPCTPPVSGLPSLYMTTLQRDDARRVAAATRIQAGFRGHRQRHQLRASTANLTRLQARVRERLTRRKVSAAKQMVLEIEQQERESRSRHQRLLAYRRELEMLDALAPAALARFAECVACVRGCLQCSSVVSVGRCGAACTGSPGRGSNGCGHVVMP
jgi:hypothetical protein